MRRWIVILVVLVNILLLVLWRSRGAEPKGASAPAGEFSAARAHAVLSGLIAEGVPHPHGTAENRRVRDRVVAQFRALGYDARIQQRFACSPYATCATVENVIAEKRSANASAEALLVAVHYDSVAAGPGASDDGTGVATVLEIARAVRDESFRNPVIFLVDDAEEIALLGAEAFVADRALSGPVAAVINFENRGTNGPSYMFETSRRNRWLIRHLANSVKQPAATSLFYTIYDRMPNDTDVTVFKREGKAAVNFAAIGNVHAYHTPLDNLANVDLRTLQHHGDNALAMLRALANADLAARSRDNAVYFDVLGFFVIWWPEGWTLWMAIASLVLLLIAARRVPSRQVTFGVLAFFAAIVIALLLGLILGKIARIGNDAFWTARPQAAIAAMWLAGIAAALLAPVLLRRTDARPTLVGHLIVWHVLAIALAATLPGASYLFLVPAILMTLALLLRAPDLIVALLGAISAALLLFPIGVVLYEALGAPSLVLTALLLAIVTTTWSPLVASRKAALIALGAAALLAIAANFFPAYTSDKPRQLSLAYMDDDERGTHWMAPAAPPELLAAAPFRNQKELPESWARRSSTFLAPAPAIQLPRVEIDAQRAGNIINVRLRSPRGAGRVILIYPAAHVADVRINGVAPPPRPERDRGATATWRSVTVYGNDATIALTAKRDAPIDVRAIDISNGLPAEGASVVAARNRAAVPSYQGDVTITQRRARL